jgi:hypothetical protein
MPKAEAQLPLTYNTNTHLSKQTNVSGEEEIPDVCPQEVAVFGKSDVLFASKAEAKDIRLGPEDTIRLSRKLTVVVVAADVDCSCAPGVGSHCATASGWRALVVL